jgi:hypothetical protein
VQPDAVLLHEPGSAIADRFTARDVHLVMAPPAGGNPVRFSVRLTESRRARTTAMTSTTTAPAR